MTITVDLIDIAFAVAAGFTAGIVLYCWDRRVARRRR